MCTSDTTDKSTKFTDFEAESTEPSCMPLAYWSTQTSAAINLLRGQPTNNCVYLPYVSPATAAAKIIQHAYINMKPHSRIDHHQLDTAPNNHHQLRQRERDDHASSQSMHTPTIAEGLRQLRRRKRDDVALIDKMREI